VLGASWKDIMRLSNDPRFMKEIIPSVNMVSTADEMSRFFQLLLNRGELGGVRVFEPITIRRATMEAGKTAIDRTVMLPMRYSTGLILGSGPIGMYGPFTKHAFGHLGFSNILCWADYDRDIAVSLINTGKALLGIHIVPLLRLLTCISLYCREKPRGE
jgi:CubicO group peptidase (beta-lactamase class C family)